MACERKSSLSAAWVELLECMQLIRFGAIENLSIRGGEPVFDPPPCVVQDVKMSSENGPRPELKLTDFALKKQIQVFVDHIEAIHNGRIRRLEVQDGLPFRMWVERENA